MKPVPRSTLVDRTAAHLREQIRSGQWADRLPGACALAAECGVSHPTVRAALRQLEGEGALVPGGDGRPRAVARRTITGPPGVAGVQILLESRFEQQDANFQLLLMQLQHALEANGHACRIAAKCQAELNHNLNRIRRFVAGQTADAWIVVGAMQHTLRWFVGRDSPVLAIGGRCTDLPVASTGWGTLDAFRKACRHLTRLGHRRIVFISSREMRLPEPGHHVRALAEELAACRATASPFNFPDWDETPAGLLVLLERAFRLTPPTAVLAESANWLAGVQAFLSRRGLRVPRDVSLFCMERDATFAWQRPTIAHLAGDNEIMIRRVVHWIRSVARNRPDLECVPCPVEFVPGESIGAPRKAPWKPRPENQ